MSEVITRRTVLRTAGAAAATATLVGCSSREPRSRQPVRISVGVDPSYAPIYLAQQDELFRDEDVDVEFVQVEGGAAGVQNISAGTTHLSVNADATILPVAAKSDRVRAIASFERSDTYFKVVLGKGVTPKTITTMVYFPGLGEYMTVRYLRSIGLDRSEVKLIKAAPPEFPAILSRGDADGFIIFDPWVSRAVKQGGHVVGESKDFDTGFSQWIIADSRWLETHSTAAGVVVRVLESAAKRIRENAKIGVEATVNQVDVPRETATSAISDIRFEVRGFTGDDYRAGRELIRFFRSVDAIDGGIDLSHIMLRDWYSENVTTA